MLGQAGRHYAFFMPFSASTEYTELISSRGHNFHQRLHPLAYTCTRATTTILAINRIKHNGTSQRIPLWPRTMVLRTHPRCGRPDLPTSIALETVTLCPRGRPFYPSGSCPISVISDVSNHIGGRATASRPHVSSTCGQAGMHIFRPMPMCCIPATAGITRDSLPKRSNVSVRVTSFA